MNLGKWRSLRGRDISSRQDDHALGQVFNPYGDLPIKPFFLVGRNRELPGFPYDQIEVIFPNPTSPT